MKVNKSTQSKAKQHGWGSCCVEVKSIFEACKDPGQSPFKPIRASLTPLLNTLS